MHFILLKYIHNIIRYMCFYKNWLNLPRSPLLHGDKRAPIICNICLHYILNKSVDRNFHPVFTLTKEKAIETLMYTLPILTLMTIQLY